MKWRIAPRLNVSHYYFESGIRYSQLTTNDFSSAACNAAFLLGKVAVVFYTETL